MANMILETREKHNIEIKDYRGKGYDNARNMSGHGQ